MILGVDNVAAASPGALLLPMGDLERPGAHADWGPGLTLTLILSGGQDDAVFLLVKSHDLCCDESDPICLWVHLAPESWNAVETRETAGGLHDRSGWVRCQYWVPDESSPAEARELVPVKS